MRTIVAGSRSIKDYQLVKTIIERTIKQHSLRITELVSGMAAGIDKLAVQWANEVGIPVKPFPANWQDFSEPCVIKTYKNGGNYNALAGFNRNLQMADYADVLIAIWNGYSNGTKHMIKVAREHNLKVFIITI